MFDESALSQIVKDNLYKCYPDAKRAHLKDGGNFPYLSRSTEVDLHLQVNLTHTLYIVSNKKLSVHAFGFSSDSFESISRDSLLCHCSVND